MYYLRDTVASVGYIPRTLPFVYMNNGVRHLRHALSLDERRVRFLPSFAGAREQKHTMTEGDKENEDAQRRFEDTVNATEAPCDVREVWFAGVHAGPPSLFPYFALSLPLTPHPQTSAAAPCRTARRTRSRASRCAG